MLRIWNSLIIMLLTWPLTVFALNGTSSFSNSVSRADLGDGSSVDIHLQPDGDVASITAGIQTIKDIIVPASFSLSSSRSSHPTAISTKPPKALASPSSSPSPTPSPSFKKPSQDSGSLIFGSNSTEAFVTDFSGAYSVPSIAATLSAGSIIVDNGSNTHSHSLPAAANPASGASGASGVQVPPGPSINAGDSPTNSAGWLFPKGVPQYHWAQVVFVFVLSRAFLSLS